MSLFYHNSTYKYHVITSNYLLPSYTLFSMVVYMYLIWFHQHFLNCIAKDIPRVPCLFKSSASFHFECILLFVASLWLMILPLVITLNNTYVLPLKVFLYHDDNFISVNCNFNLFFRVDVSVL